MTDLPRLYAHMAWADRRIIALLREQPAARTPAVLRLLAHVAAAERVWLLRLCGEDSALQPVWPELSLDEAETLAASNAAEYARYLAEQGAADPDETIAYRNTQGTEFHTRARDILLHVAMHGSYHRGQIAAGVRASGADPVNTDYITFVREEG